MEFLLDLKSHRQLILSLLILSPAFAAGYIGLLQVFGRMYADSFVYVGWAEFFAGANPGYLTEVSTLPFDASAVIISLRPVVPMLAGLLTPLLGPRPAFGVVNTVFWVLGALSCYYIGRKISSIRLGVVCAVFYGTSIPMFAYGAAVLSDCAAYCFMGLALFLTLQKKSKLLGRRRIFGEGVLMAIGSFANPAGLASLSYITIVRCWVRKNILPFVAGLAVLLVPVLLFATIAGWLAKLTQFSVYVLDLRFAGIRSGPPFVDALLWTFNLSALYLIWPYVLVHWFSLGYQLLFLCAVIAGVIYVPRKKDLLLYVPFLLVYEFVAHATIERYLFIVWPVFIPVLMFGAGKLASIITYVVDKLVRGRIRIDPLLFVALYIDVQAWVNLISLYPAVFNILRL